MEAEMYLISCGLNLNLVLWLAGWLAGFVYIPVWITCDQAFFVFLFCFALNPRVWNPQSSSSNPGILLATGIWNPDGNYLYSMARLNQSWVLVAIGLKLFQPHLRSGCLLKITKSPLRLNRFSLSKRLLYLLSLVSVLPYLHNGGSSNPAIV